MAFQGSKSKTLHYLFLEITHIITELIKILFELMSIHIKGWIKDENSNHFLLYSKERNIIGLQ